MEKAEAITGRDLIPKKGGRPRKETSSMSPNFNEFPDFKSTPKGSKIVIPDLIRDSDVFGMTGFWICPASLGYSVPE